MSEIDSIGLELACVGRPNWAAKEITTLRQKLEASEAKCRERIKADRLYNLKHGDEFAQQMAERLDQAEARCAELESEATEKRIDALNSAYILRKQAEAVELLACEWGHDEFTYSGRVVKAEIESEAQRLHQQADEAEKAGGEL